MHWFNIHALPNPEADLPDDAAGAAGAFVNCWIDYAHADGALLLARHYIEDAGWIPGDLEDSICPNRSGYDQNSTELGYFDEAVEWGYCLNFICYPPDDV